MDKIIIHCDMDNYFASVEAISNPYLELVPFVVSGDQKLRHGIVLSKNELAKKYNIETGESLFSAKKKCPDLVSVNPTYHKYLHYTKLSRNIYMEYTDKIYPYGMDEAWLDVTNEVKSIDEAYELALMIKKRVKDELKLDISCGVSFNFIYSKLASDQKLKDDVFVITKENFLELTKNIPAFNMLFVGKKTRDVLRKLNILTIEDIRNTNIQLLKTYLGKKGVDLYNYSWGNDENFNPCIESDENIKSISNTITSPKDIKKEDSVKFIYVLCDVVTKRLKNHNLKANILQLHLKYSDFTTFTKQKKLGCYTDNFDDLYKLACYILSNNTSNLFIRSITIRLSDLTYNGSEQLKLFDTNMTEVDEMIEELKNIYGNIYIERANNN